MALPDAVGIRDATRGCALRRLPRQEDEGKQRTDQLNGRSCVNQPRASAVTRGRALLAYSISLTIYPMQSEVNAERRFRLAYWLRARSDRSGAGGVRRFGPVARVLWYPGVLSDNVSQTNARKGDLAYESNSGARDADSTDGHRPGEPATPLLGRQRGRNCCPVAFTRASSAPKHAVLGI